MKRVEDICFIIYARLGSERVFGKMLRPFGGTTLMDIALKKVKQCRAIPLENFYLCVHEPELIELGDKYGVKVFKRSVESMRENSKLPVLMEWWDKLPYTYCISINAAAPLFRVQTMTDFINAFRQSEGEGMFSVVPRWTYYWNKDKQLITPWPEGEDLMNSKAVEVTYEAAGCFYAGRLDTIGDGQWMGSFQKPNDPELFVVENEDEALEIDNVWEFELCEAYYKRAWIPAVKPSVDPDIYTLDNNAELMRQGL